MDHGKAFLLCLEEGVSVPMETRTHARVGEQEFACSMRLEVSTYTCLHVDICLYVCISDGVNMGPF